MGKGSLHLRRAVMAKPKIETPGGTQSPPEIVEKELPLFDSPFWHVPTPRIELRKDKRDQIADPRYFTNGKRPWREPQRLG